MNTIQLPPTCDRTAAKALLPELTDALGPMPVAVDAGEVRKLGQAMLQVLLMASQTEGGIAIQAPSAEFSGAVQLAGLSQSLLEETGA